MDRKTILVVDDSEDNRAVYASVLEHFGYAVLQAADGYEGVRRAREGHPDLVLMDVSMPVLDGLEATRILKAEADTAAIPVIAVTAHDDAGTRTRAGRCGCDAYLCKPVRPRRVLEEVERFLGPGAAPSAH